MQQSVTFKDTQLQVNVKTGTEGPRHDPYGYEEYTFEVESKKYKLHLGLCDYLEKNGKALTENYDGILKIFPSILNKRLDQFLEEVAKLENHEDEVCPKCGCPQCNWKNGHPGETLLICDNCGEVLDSIFNESQII